MARRMGTEAGMNGTIETNGRTEANGIMKANGITGTNGMRAVLTVSRGGLDKEACERSVGAFGRWIRERFNEVAVYHAFSDARVIRELRRRGIHADGVQEALERIRTDGYMSVFVQPTHVMDGKENELMMEELDARVGYGCFTAVNVGRPLLCGRQDCQRAAGALAEAFSCAGDGDREMPVLFLADSPGKGAGRLCRRLSAVFSELGRKDLRAAAGDDSSGVLEAFSSLEAGGADRIAVQLLSFTAPEGDEISARIAGILADVRKRAGDRAEKMEVRSTEKGLGEYEEVRRIYGENLRVLLQQEGSFRV